MQVNQDKNDVKAYRRGRLSILQLMGVLAVVGILATWVLQWITQHALHLF
jgi:hypothetical protein